MKWKNKKKTRILKNMFLEPQNIKNNIYIYLFFFITIYIEKFGL